MAGYPPPPYPASKADWKAQRRAMKTQARLQRQQYRLQMRAMRRNSVVGPLLLLGAGIVFLLVQTGKMHWFATVSWYGKWWPLLLVIAGVVLLLEWMYDQHVQQERSAAGLPVRSVRVLGAGTVWLLILLAVLGGMTHWAGHAWSWDGHNFRYNFGDFDRALGEPHDSDSELVQAIPANGSLTVDNARGNVNISGTSDDGQVHVAIHKQVFALDDHAAAQRAQSLQPNVSNDQGRVTLTIPGIEGGHADLTIEVPRTVTVTVSANRGDVRVNGLHAAVVVNGNSGNIELGGLDGPAVAHLHHSGATFSAHSITGSVTLDGRSGDLNVTDIKGPVSLTGDFFGTTHVERVNGPVHFHTSRTDFQMARLDGEMELDTGSDLRADQMMGPVNLHTRQRNITLERVQGPVQVVNHDGSVTLTSAQPLGAIDIQNRHGSVNVGVPPTAGFVVQAETRHGDIENDFSLNKQGEGSHEQLNGKVADGGPTIRIQTSDGDVVVRKSTVEPLPPVPLAPPTITVIPAVPASPTPHVAVPKIPQVPVVPRAGKTQRIAPPPVVPPAPGVPAEPNPKG
jgi:DUF4097 and DUF4098 domain-containing protein YvlB